MVSWCFIWVGISSPVLVGVDQQTIKHNPRHILETNSCFFTIVLSFVFGSRCAFLSTLVLWQLTMAVQFCTVLLCVSIPKKENMWNESKTSGILQLHLLQVQPVKEKQFGGKFTQVVVEIYVNVEPLHSGKCLLLAWTEMLMKEMSTSLMSWMRLISLFIGKLIGGWLYWCSQCFSLLFSLVNISKCWNCRFFCWKKILGIFSFHFFFAFFVLFQQ